MNKRTRLVSLLTVCALASSVFTVSVGAKNEENQKIRIIIENNTLSLQDGADWDGTLVDEWVSVDSETTAVSAFLSVLEAKNYTQSGAEYDYITEINGLSAEDGGAMGGWMMTLDNWITDEGISAYTVSSGKLENGNELRFSYSCSWGADLGYDWSGSDTTLDDVIIHNGSLDSKLGDPEDTYYIVIDENKDSITVTPKVKNTAYRAKVYKNEYTPTSAGADYKPSQEISVVSGDTIYIGVANPSWMQSNYNNAQETIYKLNIVSSSDKTINYVISLIDNIGTVSLDSSSKISEAEYYYNNLADEEKSKVTNYDVLLKAKEEYQRLEAEEKNRDKKIAEAIERIDMIGEVTFYSGPSILDARKFYDSLSDEQKAKVTNYEILEKAEKEFNLINDRKEYVAPEKFRESFYEVFGTDFVYGNEWNIINAARFEIMTDDIKNGYIASVKKALDENGGSILSTTRSTVNSGVVTALSSLGEDASDFYGYDLVSPLYDTEYVNKQGVNGSIYALIALDTKNYPAPDGTREKLIKDILSAQQPDGGWTIDTWSDNKNASDADLTAMALQALAPYYNSDDVNKEVVSSIDGALAFLSEMFTDSFDSEGYGLFTSYGSYDCESSAQVMLALCALGIDVSADGRFSKDGYNVYNSLLQYLIREEMQFSHYESAGANTLSTIQGYTAAAACYRIINNKTSYYDMTDVSTSKADQESSEHETSKTIDPENDNVKTGDTTSAAFAIGLFIFSLTAGAAAAFKKKKNN